MTLLTKTDRPQRRSSRFRTRYVLGSAASVAVLLAVSACGGSSGAASGGGESVAAGASMAEFQAALADMDPVELKVQVLTPKSTAYAQAWEDYGNALKEWSGGKITYKMYYSGAITPTGIEDALKDGIIDVAPFGPSTSPDKFPIAAWTTERMTFNKNTPIVGTLQQSASAMEVAFEDPAIRQEIEDYGIHPLIPTVVGGSQNIMCGSAPANSLAELKGKQIRTSTPANQQEVKALGATTVSLPTLEIFEALQRGTVDCVATAHTLSYAINLAEATDYWVVDPEIAMAPTSEVPSVSKATWDKLPLAAQQLMHDRLDVYLQTYLGGHVIGGIAQSLQQASDNGVTIAPFADDARAKLQAFHQEVLKKDDSPQGYDGAGFVATMATANDEWAKNIADLGFSSAVTWQEFAAYQKKNPVNVQPLIDELTTTVLAKHRPE